MKYCIRPTYSMLVYLSVCVLTSCTAEPSDSPTGELEYNSELAEVLGADNYGMKRYVFAILKTGPNRPDNADDAAELQRAHMNNINRLAEEGLLVMAGPFLDNSEMRGVFLFNVSTTEEARELTESDPAVQAGSLVMELYPWYGSAALMKINDIHNRIRKENP